MRGKKVLFVLCAVAAALIVCGCKNNPTANDHQKVNDRKVFQVKGVIKELKPNGKTAIIAHETIPDYMDAMTMDFDVKDGRELTGLNPGDAVSFQMVVTKDDGWIEKVRKLAPAAPTNASQRITINPTNGTNAGPLSFRR